MPTFILNDENHVNCYGFRVLTAGIGLSRFEKNPVILDGHAADTKSVIGKWTNIRVEDGRLLADAVFDVEDEAAKIVAGKVERGFINGASMGFMYNFEEMKTDDNGVKTLMGCELMEASIVAIPGNANSVKLYARPGVLMTDSEIKLSLDTTNNFKHETGMKKINLSLAALLVLGMTAQPTEDDAASLSLSIEKLGKSLQTADEEVKRLQAEVEGYKKTLAEQKDAQALALVDEAVAKGKLTADTKAQFVEMAKQNYELAAKVIGAMPDKESLSGRVANSGKGAEITDEAFQNLTHQEQLAWKEANPEAYRKLFA